MQVIKHTLVFILGAVSIISSVTPSLPLKAVGQVNEVIKQKYGYTNAVHQTCGAKSKKTGERTNKTTGGLKGHKKANDLSVQRVGQADRSSKRNINESNKDKYVSETTIPIEKWIYQEWNARYGERIARIMVAIVKAESGMNPNAVSPTSDYGLHQIHTFKGQRNGRSVQELMNPVTNLQVAVEIYESQGLGAWSTYNSGKYRLYLN